MRDTIIFGTDEVLLIVGTSISMWEIPQVCCPQMLKTNWDRGCQKPSKQVTPNAGHPQSRGPCPVLMMGALSVGVAAGKLEFLDQCVQKSIYIYKYIHIFIYYIHICKYVHTCVNVYICIYTHTVLGWKLLDRC